MESQKKRKTREKESSEQRQSYYKNLRKEQKKKRKKRKRKSQEEIVRGESRITRGAKHALPRAPKEQPKKRRLEDCEKYLPRGKRMVSVSLQQERGKINQNIEAGTAASREKIAKRRKEILVQPVEKFIERNLGFKELATANLIRDKGARSIGSGTFGNCYPGTYRGISVVIKEYKGSARESSNRLSLLQREAKHEAQVLQQISDHPGIPLLFGVSLKEMPVSIVLKFHGEGGQSLTVHKVAKNSVISEQKNWNRILHDTADALEHIHNCGFVHNDLKSNNVVLEKRVDQLHHPVIIDFGNSVAFSKAKNPVPKPSHLRDHYKNSYIAPELVNGRGKPSVETDVYSLAFLFKTVYEILKFENIALIRNGLSSPAAKRPSISEIKAALHDAC